MVARYNGITLPAGKVVTCDPNDLATAAEFLAKIKDINFSWVFDKENVKIPQNICSYRWLISIGSRNCAIWTVSVLSVLVYLFCYKVWSKNAYFCSNCDTYEHAHWLFWSFENVRFLTC